jgi:16S rRNA processing protein RimM
MTTPPDWVAVAIMVRPHALGGAFVLKALTRTPEDLLDAPLEKLHVRRRNQIIGTLTLTSLSIHKNLPLARFEEITDRTAADQYVGCELVMPADEIWDLDEGRFYYDELVGLELIDATSGVSYGAVLRVDEGAAHDYLVFAHPVRKGQTVLLPFVHDVFIREVSLEDHRVLVTLPDGLLE